MADTQPSDDPTSPEPLHPSILLPFAHHNTLPSSSPPLHQPASSSMDLSCSQTIVDEHVAEAPIASAHHLDLPDRGVKRIRDDGQKEVHHDDPDAEMCLLERVLEADLALSAQDEIRTSVKKIRVDLSTDDARMGGHDHIVMAVEAEASKEASVEDGAQAEAQEEPKVEALVEGGTETLVEDGTETRYKVEDEDLTRSEAFVERVVGANLPPSTQDEFGTSAMTIRVDISTDDAPMEGRDDSMTVAEAETGKEVSIENDGAEVEVQGEAKIEALVEGGTQTEDKVEDEDLAESEVFVERDLDANLPPSAQDGIGTSPEKILVDFFTDDAKVGGHDDTMTGAESEIIKEPSVEDGTEVEAQNEAKIEALVEDGTETGDNVEVEDETEIETVVEGGIETEYREEAQDEGKIEALLKVKTKTGDKEEAPDKVKIEALMEGRRETGDIVEAQDEAKIEALGEGGTETGDKEETQGEGKIEALVEGRTETGGKEEAQDQVKIEALMEGGRETGNMVEAPDEAKIKALGEGGTETGDMEEAQGKGKIEAFVEGRTETGDKVEAQDEAKIEALVEERTEIREKEEPQDEGKFEALLVEGRTETGDKVEAQDEAKILALVEGGTETGGKVEDEDLIITEAFVEGGTETGVKVEDEDFTVTEAFVEGGIETGVNVLAEAKNHASDQEEPIEVQDGDLTITEAFVESGAETGVNVEDEDLTVTEASVEGGTETGVKVEDGDLTVTEVFAEGGTLAEAKDHASIQEEPTEVEDEDLTITEAFVEGGAETGNNVEDEDLTVTEAFLEGGPETAVKVEDEDLTVNEAFVEGGTLAEAKDHVSDQEVHIEGEFIQSSEMAAVCGQEEQNGTSQVKLGPKVFTSSKQMFDFFYELLHGWPLNININKYEHMMLMDLISKGHQDPPSKIGVGIKAFQIQVNPDYYSRCYYLIRNDGSTEDFSYRKCIDKLLPLPANMVSPPGEWDLDKIVGKETNGQKGAGSQKARVGGGPSGGKCFHGKHKGRGGRFGGSGARGKGNYGRGGHRDH